jgi:hypothetical protein
MMATAVHPSIRLGGVAAALDLERAPRDDVCVAMSPITHQSGLIHFLVSSSSTQRDLTSGAAASRWLPGGGSLGLWVNAEEETMVQLLKRVRMPSSMMVQVRVNSSLEAMLGGGGVSPSIVSEKNLKSGVRHH